MQQGSLAASSRSFMPRRAQGRGLWSFWGKQSDDPVQALSFGCSPPFHAEAGRSCSCCAALTLILPAQPYEAETWHMQRVPLQQSLPKVLQAHMGRGVTVTLNLKHSHSSTPNCSGQTKCNYSDQKSNLNAKPGDFAQIKWSKLLHQQCCFQKDVDR